MGRPKGSKNKVPWALKKEEIQRRAAEDARDPDLVEISAFLKREEPLAFQRALAYRKPVEDLTEFVKALVGSHAV